MKFTQKRSGHKTSFMFDDDAIHYESSHNGLKQGASLPYQKIPNEWLYQSANDDTSHYSRLIGFAILLVGLFFTHKGIREGGDRNMEVMLLFMTLTGIVVAAHLLYKKAVLTVIGGNPPLLVLNDHNRDAIMAEIMRRSEERTRLKGMDIDFSADPVDESKKFFWLRYRGLITEQEFNNALSRLIAMKQSGKMENFDGPGKVLS